MAQLTSTFSFESVALDLCDPEPFDSNEVVDTPLDDLIRAN
jgi:hypothetical protein